MNTEISDSGYVSINDFSPKWTDIILLQKRNQNCIYSAKKLGKRFILKGISAEYRYSTDVRILQEKEFTFGFSLTHPYIAGVYSLEEMPTLGRCIVMEYVDGITLAEWLTTSPSIAARERVLMQLLEALEYIHSFQLVHHDLKSSNILITHNGNNLKLIDFGLSDSDSTCTSMCNDPSRDIKSVGNILMLLFPNRYIRVRKLCLKGQYTNISSVSKSIKKRNQFLGLLPYLIPIVFLVLSTILFLHTRSLYNESKQITEFAEEYTDYHRRENEMHNHIVSNIQSLVEKIRILADTTKSYTEFSQKGMQLWLEAGQIIDSLANQYTDDLALQLRCSETWKLMYSEQYMQIDAQVKNSKPLY